MMFNEIAKLENFKRPVNVQVPENITNQFSTTPKNNAGEKNMAALSLLLSQTASMNIQDKFKKFSEAVGTIDASEKEAFNAIYSSMQSTIEAHDTSRRLAHEQELLKQKNTELSNEKQTLELNLIKSREQSWSERIDKMSLEFSQGGHHTGVINEFKRLFSAMPEEARTIKFSVDKVEFSFSDAVKAILDKLPKEARLTQEFNLVNSPDKNGAYSNHPNNGAVDGAPPVNNVPANPPVNNVPANPPVNNNNAKFSHIPADALAKVQKYCANYPTVPVPDISMIKVINDDGRIDLSLAK